MATQPPDGPVDFDLIRMIAEATADDSDPVPLLDLASTLAAAIIRDTAEKRGDTDHYPLMSPQTRAEVQREGLVALQSIAAQMLESTDGAAEPLVRVWAAMFDDELFRRRLLRDLPPRNRHTPEWVRRADEIRPRRAATIVSPVLIEETVFVEISTAARSCTLAVAIERSGNPFLEDAFITPESFDSVMAGIVANPELDVDRIELDPADARARITDALEMSDHIVPPVETDSWPGIRAFTEWMIRLLPAGGTGIELREWTPEELEYLASEFHASPWAAGLTVTERDHALRLFELQANYGNNDPLRWSGTFVDFLLHDLYPRKVMAPDDYMLAMPAALAALVQYANERSGVDPSFTRNALDALEAGSAAYVRRITEGPIGYSEYLDSPEFPLTEEEYQALPATLRALIDDDLAGPPPDLDPVWGRFLSDYVGGPENLASLDTVPLPLEDFDPSGLPDDVVDRLQPLLPQIRTIAVDFFADAEIATITYRILAEVARRDPAIFRRRFADANMLAALFWVAGSNNDAFDLSERNGVVRSIKNLQAHLGVKTAPNQRGNTLLRALGRPNEGMGVVLGDPGLLTSERRDRLILIREAVDPDR